MTRNDKAYGMHKQEATRTREAEQKSSTEENEKTTRNVEQKETEKRKMKN
jgi:hypothetical protein